MENQKHLNVTIMDKGLSGSTLKIIAIITMLIDHVGAGIIAQLPTFSVSNTDLMLLYFIMRKVGRVAFPIFCFLLVEGFLHTRNVKKYALRLFIFAIISEIPFDLAFFGQIFETSHQNVFFTLFIGLLTLTAIQYFDNNKFIKLISMFAGICIAQFLATDYGGFGVVFIVLLYMFHDNIKLRNIICSVAILWEVTAPIAFIPITLYNGSRGIKMKYFFYVFYPIHLLMIYVIAQFI
ncbi:MAG: TraX family protein [Lachnotalea sp.]